MEKKMDIFDIDKSEQFNHRKNDIEYLVSIISSCTIKAESELKHEFNENTIREAEHSGYIRNYGQGNYIATNSGHELAHQYSNKQNELIQPSQPDILAKWINQNCFFNKTSATNNFVNRMLKFADDLPKSDITDIKEKEFDKKYPKSSYYIMKMLENEIPKEIADQISAKYPDLNFLANGSYGVVYKNRNKPGWLVKVTTDASEVQAIERIENSGKTAPKECVVEYGKYMTIQTKDTHGNLKTVGIIETRQIETLARQEAEFVDAIQGIISEHFYEIQRKRRNPLTTEEEELNYDKNTFKQNILKKNEEFTGVFESLLATLDEGGYDIFDKYMELRHCLLSNGFSDGDMHSGNIGKINERYYLIDFGHII